jgi:acyl-homoserine lactone acylase PvdQ
MKQLVLIVAATCVSCAPPAAADKDGTVAAWEREARNVTIIRDNWGIPHIYGKTDADFNRVETNYLNSMGRLAEAEGVAVVEFGDRVQAKAVTAGGQSGDPSSPHFNDQASRYSTGELRDVYFNRPQLEGHIERQYHPGD